MGSERAPLSQREYLALQTVFGAVSTLETHIGDLEKRAKLSKNTWRDLCMVRKVLDRVLDNLLRTIPEKKLMAIQRELHSTQLSIKVTGVATRERPADMCYVTSSALDNLVDKVVGLECLFCQKRGADVKRCQLRKDLDSLFPWDIDLKGNVCPLAMYNEKNFEEENG